MAIYFGLDTARHNPQLEALADICDGWPRHLRFAGEVLGRTALDEDGDMGSMNWPAMRRMTWSLRQEYYSDQTDFDMQEADILTARVMTGLRDGMHIGQVEELVLDSVVDRPRQRLPEGRSARWFIDRLIHPGALYRNPKGRIHSPIPSFRSYLIEHGTETDRTAAIKTTDPDFSP